MSARRAGFTLVETLVASVLAALIMGAIYETLTVQQKSARQIAAVTNTQQTVRTAMQVLQSELREVGGRPGDIIEAAPDHVKFHALRKVGFVCAITSASSVDMFSMGSDAFQAGDTVYIHEDEGTSSTIDDSTALALVTGIGASGSVGCNPAALASAPWTSMNVQALSATLTLLSGSLSKVSAGAPIRSTKTVTYGIYAKGSDYVLGRRDALADSVVTLIGPLAPSGGLTLQYFDTANNPIAAASLASSLRGVGRFNVSIIGRSNGAAKAGTTYSDSLTTDITLRGN